MEGFTHSVDVQWQIMRNNSAFLHKKKNGRFSREPNNLKNIHSRRHCGLIHAKTVDVLPCKDGKGVTLVTRKVKAGEAGCKPSKSFVKVDLKKDNRRILKSVKNIVGKSGYRKDLNKAALRRTCAILKSQKPVIVKKKAAATKKKD